MSAEVQKQPVAKAPPVPSIKSVRFVESVPFNATESTSVQMAPGRCDRVFAARIEADGSAVAIGQNQRADGLLFERDYTKPGEKQKQLEGVFVPWANIRGVAY